MDKMPVLFVGHGSPTNVIENNMFTKGWEDIAGKIEKPVAILAISAHWETNGTFVSAVKEPETIHDFYGFPREMYEITYPAKGSPEFAKETLRLLDGLAKEGDWGLDHGVWCVLRKMYPQADIPVFQMSLDRYATPEKLFEIGTALKSLREQGVLILGSGNVVHNLRELDFNKKEPFTWAREFDQFVQEMIEKRDWKELFAYSSKQRANMQAVPTTEHFHPIFVILGLLDDKDSLLVYNKEYVAGSLSMTSYLGIRQ